MDEFGNPIDGSQVGPQTNGTYVYPGAAQPLNQPWDSGAPSTGAYSPAVLDLFKTGIQAVSSAYQTNQLIDYKKYEATQGGLFRQGAPAIFANGATGTNGSGMLMLLLIVGGIVLLAK